MRIARSICSVLYLINYCGGPSGPGYPLPCPVVSPRQELRGMPLLSLPHRPQELLARRVPIKDLCMDHNYWSPEMISLTISGLTR